MKLSPLNFRRLIERHEDAEADPLFPVGKKARGDVKAVSMYRCPACLELHDDRSGAEECCPVDAGGEVKCPVCGGGSPDEYEAADCCLWKDLPAPDRWRIARQVESGASWLEAVTRHAQQAAA